jgi:hypothetical protein
MPDCLAESAPGHAAARLRPSNRVLIRNPLGEKTKRPHKGAFSFSGGGASHMRSMLCRVASLSIDCLFG